MDYRKINSHIILFGVVAIIGLLSAIIVRLSMLENGADSGTANLMFLLILGASAVVYLIIIATLSRYIIPCLMKIISRLTKKPIPLEMLDQEQKQAAKEENPIAEAAPPAPVQETIPAKEEGVAPVPTVDIDKIKQNADQQYIERLRAKIELFRRYTHIVIGPHVTADELARLDEYIECYAKEAKLSKDVKPIKPDKLKNPDLFHFGWNMAHYFEQKKQDVVPWLQKVFKELSDLEPSYIKGKLHDQQSRRFTIPNTEDIPKYLDDLKG